MFEILLDWIGLAKASEIAANKLELQRISANLANADQQIADLRSRLGQAQNDLHTWGAKYARLTGQVNRVRWRQEWCDPSLVEMPSHCPSEFRLNTDAAARKYVREFSSLFNLCDATRFANPEQWTLYWCLIHASKAATAAARVAKNENGISREFLTALEAQAKEASISGENPERLQIAYCSIFEQSAPGMKEAATGADILLIVAGEGLISSGGARIFWIQAKKAKSPLKPFVLNYDQANCEELQVDALARVNSPEHGAFGLYMQYSEALACIPAVSVGDLHRDSDCLIADLGVIGARMPELVVAYACDRKNVGAFVSLQDLRDYLDSVSDRKPMYIVTATVETPSLRRDFGPGQLLSELSDYFLEKFGVARGRARNFSRNLGREIG